jgi:hypothetical protein
VVLKIGARVEFVSLVLLFTNLATVHWAEVAALLGPIHGCAYLVVIGATLRATSDLRTRLLSVVPGIGGLLVIRRLSGGRPRGADRRGGPATDGPPAGKAQANQTQANQTQADRAQADGTEVGNIEVRGM